MEGYYVDGAISPAAEPTTAEGDIFPKEESFVEAPANYRAGALFTTDGGNDQFTTTESFTTDAAAEADADDE